MLSDFVVHLETHLFKTRLNFTKLFQRMFAKREMRILMVGLDVAGKIVVLYKLTVGEIVTIVPTFGFNVENVEDKNVKLHSLRCGSSGYDSITVEELILEYTVSYLCVVDSNGKDCVAEPRDELQY